MSLSFESSLPHHTKKQKLMLERMKMMIAESVDTKPRWTWEQCIDFLAISACNQSHVVENIFPFSLLKVLEKKL